MKEFAKRVGVPVPVVYKFLQTDLPPPQMHQTNMMNAGWDAGTPIAQISHYTHFQVLICLNRNLLISLIQFHFVFLRIELWPKTVLNNVCYINLNMFGPKMGQTQT